MKRWLCRIGLHHRVEVHRFDPETGRTLPTFAFHCSRCGRWFRRIPGREWEPIT